MQVTTPDRGSRWFYIPTGIAFGLLYAPVLAHLAFDWWNDPGASYGFIIPVIVLWLVWNSRKRIYREPARPDWRGLLGVIFSCAVLLLGTLGAEFFVTRISLVLLIVSFVWTFWGVRRLRTLTFPLVMLATMIPLPALIYNRLAMPLQLLASEITTELVRLSGGTVYRDGNILHLPQFTIGVAEACSGLNSLSAVVVTALLMGSSHCATALCRIIVVAFSIPLAIAVNVFRVAGTVFLARADQELAMGFYHAFSGWLVFIGSAILVLKLAKVLHRTVEV
jgi:exosortase